MSSVLWRQYKLITDFLFIHVAPAIGSGLLTRGGGDGGKVLGFGYRIVVVAGLVMRIGC